MAAGSEFGYSLLWVVTLSTLMLIVLQHNAAHLGIATGMCLAEATTRHLPRPVGRVLLGTAYLACIATAMAEVLGGAIALQMLFDLPLRAGCLIVAAASMTMLLTSSYKKAERWIIAFVSVVGLSFLAELAMVQVDNPAKRRATAKIVELAGPRMGESVTAAAARSSPTMPREKNVDAARMTIAELMAQPTPIEKSVSSSS